MFVDGCAQHIIQRGNNRSVCFYNNADYAFYLQQLKETSIRNNVEIHAFVLMTNHVHLLVTGQNKQSIPKMMQSLGRNFVRYINITYQRTGTLWEGRYKSALVSTRQYFLTVSRYIELNPVRANMVRLPGAYPWSSYRHNAMGINISLITEHEEYQGLASSRAKRLLAYRSLFNDEIPNQLLDEIRFSTNKGWILGNDKFQQEIEVALKRKLSRPKWGGDRKTVLLRDQEL